MRSRNLWVFTVLAVMTLLAVAVPGRADRACLSDDEEGPGRYSPVNPPEACAGDYDVTHVLFEVRRDSDIASIRIYDDGSIRYAGNASAICAPAVCPARIEPWQMILDFEQGRAVALMTDAWRFSAQGYSEETLVPAADERTSGRFNDQPTMERVALRRVKRGSVALASFGETQLSVVKFRLYKDIVSIALPDPATL